MRLPRGRHRPSGFSQVELAIAIIVLSVGLLGVFASFAFGLRAVHHGARTSLATSHARRMVEMIRARNLAFTAGTLRSESALTAQNLLDTPDEYYPDGTLKTRGDRRDLTDLPFSPADFEGIDIEGFKRNIRITRFSGDAADYRYNVARIVVTVYWYEKGSERRVQLEALDRSS